MSNEPTSLGEIMQQAHLARTQPKPRLGDYYAGHTYADWDSLDLPDQELFLALAVFGGAARVNPEWNAWIEASDAFAFGARKYGVGCWRDVSSDDHMQGAGRHLKARLEDINSVDDESGLPHRKHFLARAIMCLEQRRMGK